jgi:hypothetical protein
MVASSCQSRPIVDHAPPQVNLAIPVSIIWVN